MTDWKIDSKLHRAARGEEIVKFFYDGKVWQIETPEDGKPPVGANVALKDWNAALAKGTDFLRKVGEVCYGDDWIMPLSFDLDIARSSVQRWLKFERPLTMDHPIWHRISTIIDERHAQLAEQMNELPKVRVELSKILSRVDTIESGRYAGSES